MTARETKLPLPPLLLLLLFVLKTSLDSLALSLISWFVEQCKHVLLVCLYSRLVERVNSEDIAADAATNLEEVDELAEIILVEFGHRDADVRHTAINVSKACAKLCHLVYVIHALAGEEVQSVEVLIVVGEEHCAVGLLYADDSFVDSALAFLNPLTHGVEIGSEVTRSGEDTLSVLAFALAVELLPPLAHEVEFGLIVDHNLNLLACLGIQGV